MIPSLVVTEIRSALIEYLASTFALADDEVRDALSSFLEDEAEGIFRGPYLKVRTPFRSVGPDWVSPLEWSPAGFTPYLHQATAFERLSTNDGRSASPTLVTTGTGSGKTECFLLPVLDHCARMREAGQEGIKAIILYPMNALASDQAGRIAETIATEAALAGVTAGLYVGEAGRHTTMSAESIIDKREALRAEPPDILLTNYKMLDFLLLRADDRELWSANTAETLRYVVLDEFHTYDGAQGTDVAMLLRRLGATLQMATPDRPLGAATPVATSATLGSGPSALDELRDFAGKVFGATFDEGSVIGETRQTAEEACDVTDFEQMIPEPADVAHLTDLDEVANAFCARPDDPTPVGDVVGLGERLLAHPLTKPILSVVGERSRSWADAVAEIVAFAPNWGRALMTGQGKDVERALSQYLWLLSVARRNVGGRERPLFTVEVQIWIREVSRVLRSVDAAPAFRWRDSASAIDEEAAPVRPGDELPAVYCRRCGMSGWMALASESSDAYSVNPNAIAMAALGRSPLVRTLIKAHPDDAACRWYSPSRQILDNDASDRVPVLVTASEDDARANRCPGCGERDGIRFLGLAVASLASVSINTLFASHHLEENERKLLAFTDSVQDASHRAGFFGGRTHRINLRSLMSGLVREQGRLTLDSIGDELVAQADTDRGRFGLVPPDLLRHPAVRTVWTEEPAPGALDLLRARAGFEADLEFGLRARVGRTLELSRAAAAGVSLEDHDAWADLIGEEVQRITGERPDPLAVTNYLRGFLERLRLRGGVVNLLLQPFLDSGGRQWFLWGGRPDGLPPFTPDQGRPSFFSTATRTDLDSLTGAPGPNPTWLVDWAVRTLDLEPNFGRDLNAFVANLLAKETDTLRAVTIGGSTSYGLNRASILVYDVGEGEASQVRCNICGHVHVAPPDQLDQWTATPCLRYRCVGHFDVFDARGGDYYRNLYRSGSTRRVVTGEHTGLLGRAAREDLERAFKTGTAPDAPNVLTATPTLEMGIDIGDLSAVMLTSVPRNPASYVQRVGRAGRSTGNSLVTTFVRTDTHGLYYLSDPEAMITGDVRPPNCYLDAVETLQRQYLAYLIDRVADDTIDAPPLSHQIGALMRAGLGPDTFLSAIVAASTEDTAHVETFVSLFGHQLADSTVDTLRRFASEGIEGAVGDAIASWEHTVSEFRNRLQRLTGAADRLEAQAAPGPEQEAELASLRGQRSAVRRLLENHRNEYTISALERLGLLPNYTLVDDATTLSATMWSRDDAGQYETEVFEYQRAGRMAIREFAPGNSFYAGGHRHLVDALEIGSAQEPLYEQWRLCPDCGFAELEREGDAVTVCTRCAGTGIADTGARHLMLRLKTALASGSEEAARVFDDRDDRRRERYDMATIVDVEPDSIDGAWTLTGRAFGAEFAGRTHIRTLNLGMAERAGETIPIAGNGHHVARFTVCAHCGAVRDAREQPGRATNEDRLHQGWCKVRSGALSARWDEILLFHELSTEAIRIVAPVSMFEVDERLASFKGALLLGLREDFGGDPDHLEVALADSPNRGGEGRRRYLVLFDRVPGGTGYLARMGDPERMRAILDAGRSVIAHCPCANEGRSACHRCLLGVVDRNEYDLVGRDLALGILDDLLDAWDTEPVATVGEIDIGKVQESELERRFKVALRDWADRNPNENISFQTVPGRERYDAFELRLEHDGVRTRYRIDEQEGLATSPSTVPDYLIRRMDDRSPDVAVYLDGHQFHASAENNNIAADALKRRAVRADGKLVWNLTWHDVDAFHQAALADPPRDPTPRTLLKGRARSIAQQVQHAKGGLYDTDAVNQNPMALLVDLLARANHEQWRRLALSAVAGLAADGISPTVVNDGSLVKTIQTAIGGLDLDSDGGTGDPTCQRFTAATSDGLQITLLLDVREQRENDERWTVITSLDDPPAVDSGSPADEHRRRWRDWLHWANVLQLASGPGTEVVIAAVSEAETYPVEDLNLAASTQAAALDASTAFIEVEVSDAMHEELELIIDSNVATLVEAVLRGGAPDFEAGPELDGIPLEAAWSLQKVAVLAGGQDAIGNNGWDARPAQEWTSDELLHVLEERR